LLAKLFIVYGCVLLYRIKHANKKVGQLWNEIHFI